MDPLSHAALGRTLIGIAWRDPQRGAVALAATLGALSPDIDAVFMPAGWDRYLRVHEIGTHTLLGTLVCGALTALVVRAFFRTCPWRMLAAAGWIGAASHVLLDLVSSARLRLLWPFLDTQISVPLVAMADPWLGGVLVAGAIAVVARGRRGGGRLAAIVTITACGLLLGWKAAGALRASSAYAAAASVKPALSHIVEAEWASLTRWRVFDRTDTHVRAWTVDGLRARAELRLEWPVTPETPLVTASRSLSTVRNFLRPHALGFAVTVPRSATEHWVLWSDVRYCWTTRPGTARTDLTVSTGGTTLGCALWFGGAFDPERNPLQEIVRIGSFTQNREPAR